MPQQLSQLILFLTHRCNVQCHFCFNTLLTKNTQEKNNAELSLVEYGKIAQKIGPLLQVICGGGEPFLRDDITDIVVAFYRHASTRLFSISTNGFLVQSIIAHVDKMVTHCPQAVFNIGVSIDAYGKKHDDLRQCQGLFEKAVTLCHEILRMQEKYKNVNLVINTTITEYNIDDIINLRSFLQTELNVSLLFHNICYDCRSRSKLFSSFEMINKVILLEKRLYKRNGRWFTLFQKIIDCYYVKFINTLLIRQRMQKKHLFHCNAGRKVCVILPNGEVSPCEPFIFEEDYKHFQRYNLRDYGYDYAMIRQEKAYQEVLQYIRKQKCHPCHWSCAAITSMLYSPCNWLQLLTNPTLQSHAVLEK